MAFENISVGLFGGSFNPAHAGHMHVAMTGLNTLGLNQVWWMVSPQNPLKPKQPSYESRTETVTKLGLPYQMRISGMEHEFGTHYTVDTLKAAKKRWPQTRFVFLMGADNFLQLPKWKGWQEIMSLVPMAIISRRGEEHTASRARLGLAASLYRNARIPENQAHTLHSRSAPAWTYLTPPLNALSSSAIRASLSKP
ncbi:MAG: nicotinate (nicotinamide) nucleotide adenylyltransferase [Alphaproteobacteria bacterium]